MEESNVMDREISIRKCAHVLGIPYGWLVQQVNRGLNPPPRYRRPGYEQWKVKPREVREWYEQTTRG